MRCSIRLAYLLLYNLVQFCGNTWIFANMTARFVFFGRGAQADTFYSVGVIMSLCQLLSVLELFHIADGLEKGRLFSRFVQFREDCPPFPQWTSLLWCVEKGRLFSRFVQVVERNLLLFVVFVSVEEFQSHPMVCVQFCLWNILQLLRYPHGLLCLVSTPSANTLWARYTLSIPVYVLSVLTEGLSIWQALPFFEDGLFSVQLQEPVQVLIYFPYVLIAYLPLLATAASVTVWLLLKERKQQLDSWNKKLKRK